MLKTKEVMEAALIGFEGRRQEIDGKIRGLEEVLAGKQQTAREAIGATVEEKPKRTVSASGRRRMREAQRRRWAAIYGKRKKAARA